MTTSRPWLRQPPSSPSVFRSQRSIPLRKPPAPPGGKTPPSAGPSRGVGERPVAYGRRRIDLAPGPSPGFNFLGASGARSASPDYNFLRATGGASARLVLTDTRGTSAAISDPTARIESASSSQL